MAVLGRLLISSAERMDLPDLLSIDSYSAGDWKYFLQGLVGTQTPYILNGFDIIDPQTAIGTQSCSITVAGSCVFYPGSSAGSFFYGLPEGNPNALPLVPELRKNATNYVYLTFSTTNTSVDTRAFWDPDANGGTGGEFTQDVNTESVLQVVVNVSTGSFPANTIPVAEVVVGPVVITSITDCRNLMFRLGSGGIAPDPFSTYAFRSLPNAGFQRNEPPVTMLPGGDNPFQGGDKNIYTLKEWMDLVMTKLKELSGTTYWYEDTSSFNLITEFIDGLATTFKSKGQWNHNVTTAGELTWTEDLVIEVTQDPRNTIVRAGTIVIPNENVAYIELQRNELFNSSDAGVQWTNGQVYVNTVGGAVGYFTNLKQGDYVRQVSDANYLYLRVEQFYDSVNLGGSVTTPANARSIRLSAAYQGPTAIQSGRADKGVYQPSDIIISSRSNAALASTGGDFHWLALRSDTIENLGSAVATTVTGTLAGLDGTKGEVTATAHGLQTGDYITVSAPAAQAGTYEVQVIDANNFYIQTTNLTGGAFTGYYAVITTAARDNGYGLQIESADHGMQSGDTAIISGTTNFNGSYIVSKRSATQLQIAIASAPATETSGLVTSAIIIVRAEQGLTKIVQGETIDIGEAGVNNLKSFIGMGSFAETYPIYALPTGYNTLNGTQNYFSGITDSLTLRASKLTAMMADKAQDKTIKYAPANLTSVTNTTVGSAQQITFNGPSATLTIVTPGSNGNATIALPFTSPGISLLANQCAYVTINRNAPTTPTINVTNTANLVIDENIFVIAVRLSTTAVYLWDSSNISSGGSTPTTLASIVQQNQILKLVQGGSWNWNLTTQTLSWSLPAYIQIPGMPNSANSIAAGSIALTSNQIAYVEINRSGAGGALTVLAAANDTFTPDTNTIVIARREGANVLVGNSFQLADGDYLELDGAMQEIDRRLNQLRLTANETLAYRARISASDIVQLDGTTLSQELSTLVLAFTGSVIDFSTGNVYASDGTTPLGTNFTPFAIPVGQYFWYSVGLLPSAVNANNTIGATVQIAQAASASATQSAAPYALLLGSKKIGAVQLFNNAGNLQIVAVRRFGASGGGGSGSGSGFIKATYYNPISTTLPTGTSATVDGASVVNGDLVFFTNLSTGNNEIYQVSGVGTSLVWTPQYIFSNGATSPSAGDSIRIISGTMFRGQIVYYTQFGTWVVNDTIRLFNGSKGTDYWEMSSIKTVTLNDATTNGAVFTVAVSGSENWVLNYSASRGVGLKETGSLYITSDGATAKVATGGAYLSDVGVTFDAVIASGNLTLRYTTTSTGSPITMKFWSARWSDAAGGPSGVPSYSSGGGTTPAAGNTSDIQYKGNDGNLAGDDRFQWNASGGYLNIGGLSISGLSSPVVLADGQSTPATIFSMPTASTSSMIVEYSVLRNGDTQVGRLLVTNNGVTSASSDDHVNTAALGILFSSAISGSNVVVQYTTTTTTFNAAMKYNIRSWL